MNRDGTLFLPGVDARLCACLGARLLPQSYQYPNLSEGADRVGGQLRGDNECPFSGVTESGRVWRKVPESDARSVEVTLCGRQNGKVQLLTDCCVPGLYICSSQTRRGTGIVQWLQRQTRDRKVSGSGPGRNGRRIFFSRVNFPC